MLGIAVLLLLIGVALGGYVPYEYYDLDGAKDYFDDYMSKYDRNYENIEEYFRRLEIFKKNLMKYNEWNKQLQSDTAGHAINQYSDQEGPISCLNWSLMRNTTNPIKVKPRFLKHLRASVDYRKQNLVTSIKNQKHCGSCYDFAAIANIEGMHAKKNGELVDLSEQQGLDCFDGDCAYGGVPLEVVQGLAKQGGCGSAADYPYEAVKKTCRADKSKFKVKVTEGHTIDTPDVDSLKAALVQNGAPLAISMYAPASMMSVHGRVILNPDDCADRRANHAVLLVGYDVDKKSGATYWIIKNSWGTEVGDNGYFYFDVNCRCSIGKEQTITSSVE